MLSHKQFLNLSELIEMLIYFIKLCVGTPCTCKLFIANFTGVDFWTSPYTNGTVDFMISPKEYTRVVRHLQHEKIPFKVNKMCEIFFKVLNIHMLSLGLGGLHMAFLTRGYKIGKFLVMTFLIWYKAPPHANLQQYISFKHFHFGDEVELILLPQFRNAVTHLKIICDSIFISFLSNKMNEVKY